MELWDGYNENEEKIGVDIVRGEKISKGILHAVVDVIVYHEDGTFLLMQRDWNKPNKPGLWEAGASGSVVKGEEFLDAAKRELYEETGLKVADMTTDGNAYFSSPGMTDETCAIVRCIAIGEIKNDYQERNEEIEVVLVDTDEILRILREENVCLKTALVMTELILDQQFPRSEKKIGD